MFAGGCWGRRQTINATGVPEVSVGRKFFSTLYPARTFNLLQIICESDRAGALLDSAAFAAAKRAQRHTPSPSVLHTSREDGVRIGDADCADFNGRGGPMARPDVNSDYRVHSPPRPGQLVGQLVGVVDLAQRFDDARRVDRDGPGHCRRCRRSPAPATGCCRRRSGRRLRRSRLMTGLPELPPMMSAVQTKLNGVFRFELVLALDPARRQIERRLVVVLRRRARTGRRTCVSNGTCLPFSS